MTPIRTGGRESSPLQRRPRAAAPSYATKHYPESRSRQPTERTDTAAVKLQGASGGGFGVSTWLAHGAGTMCSALPARLRSCAYIHVSTLNSKATVAEIALVVLSELSEILSVVSFGRRAEANWRLRACAWQ